MLRRLGTVAGVAVAAGAVVNTCLFNVDAGQRAVIFDRFRGVKPNTISEGTHFYIPGIQKVFIMDVRTTPRTISTLTGTKDLQTVNLSLRVLTRPTIDKLADIYSKIGLDYSERVLPSICNEVLKAVVAQYDAAELLTLRDQVSSKIREQLNRRAREFNIELDDVSITHLTFSPDFAKAIEDKQVAEQNAERAKFLVQKAEQEKEALIIRSEGDSEAAFLVSKALAEHGQGLIELRRIETASYIAETLSKHNNVVYLPSQGEGGGSRAQFLLPLSK
jgi:prohibitin 1